MKSQSFMQEMKFMKMEVVKTKFMIVKIRKI